MTFDSLLINECDIQEFTETGTDDYGRPTGNWTLTYENEPCRHVSGKGREVKVGQEVMIIYDELFVGDIEVTDQDQVIIHPDDLTYQIIAVLFRQDGKGSHHKHLFLEIVK